MSLSGQSRPWLAKESSTMPELKPLPCPACGDNDVKMDFSAFNGTLIGHYVRCNMCALRGPLCDGENEAARRYNALPRALTWTTEPPKVAGWYSWRSGKGQNITMIQTHIFNGVCGYWDGNGVFKTDLNRGEWAGPIPAPID